MKLKPNETIVLKSVGSNYNNFKYPKRGWVEAPDWLPNYNCGNGLHGNECGKAGYDLREHGDKFAVIKVNKDDGFVDLDDKCKFRKGYVIKTFNTLLEAYNYIRSYKPEDVYFNYDVQVANGKAVQRAGNSSTQIAGNSSTQIAGEKSNQRAGSSSNQIAGEHSNQTAGNDSTQKSGAISNQKAGNYSNQISEFSSTQTAGNDSTQKAGASSNQKAGNRATQTADFASKQEAGNYSTQTAGRYSTHIIIGNNCMIKLSKGSVLIMQTDYNTLVFTDEDLPINEWVSIEIED